MTIKEIVKKSGMTQRKFAEHLNIPLRTLGDWVTEKRKCPNYTAALIEEKLINDGLISGSTTNYSSAQKNNDNIIVRKYAAADVAAMAEIWNTVVKEANAFPQFDCLDDDAEEFFGSQSYCGVAESNGEIVGMYILHPNNVGRCGHIANASYAVKSTQRGKGIGRLLVEDCLAQGKELGFRILQFNAVVASNTGAIRLYEKLGFIQTGRVEGGFLNGNEQYEDIILFYHKL